MKHDLTYEEFQHQLQLYVNHELSDNDQKTFEEAVKANPKFQEELEFSLKLGFAIKHKEVLEVNEIAGQAIQVELEKVGQSFNLSGRKLWIGLLLLLFSLSAVGVIWYQTMEQNRIESAQSIYAQHIKPLEPLLVTSLESNRIVDQGMQAYNAGNYDKTIEILTPYYQRTTDYNIGLYLGVSHLLSQKTSAAIPILSSVQLNTSGPIQDSANWYLGLAYLKLGDYTKARSTFNQMAPTGIYAKQLQEILNAL